MESVLVTVGLVVRLMASPRRWGVGDVLECVQHPGDVLFIPDGWHHGVLSLGETVSFARNGDDAAPGTVWEAFLRGQAAVHQAKGSGASGRRLLLEAEVAGKEALRLAGGNCPQCWIHLGVVYSLLQKPKLEMKASRNAVELNREDPMAWMNLAFVLAEGRLFDEALSAVRAAQRLIGQPGRGVRLSYPLKLIAQSREGRDRDSLLKEATAWS